MSVMQVQKSSVRRQMCDVDMKDGIIAEKPFFQARDVGSYSANIRQTLENKRTIVFVLNCPGPCWWKLRGWSRSTIGC